MQQHPLPNSRAETIVVQSQRAIMALLPSAKPGGRRPLDSQRSHGNTKSRATRGYLSAVKLGPIEKIGTSGTFCRRPPSHFLPLALLASIGSRRAHKAEAQATWLLIKRGTTHAVIMGEQSFCNE